MSGSVRHKTIMEYFKPNCGTASERRSIAAAACVILEPI